MTKYPYKTNPLFLYGNSKCRIAESMRGGTQHAQNWHRNANQGLRAGCHMDWPSRARKKEDGLLVKKVSSFSVALITLVRLLWKLLVAIRGPSTVARPPLQYKSYYQRSCVFETLLGEIWHYYSEVTEFRENYIVNKSLLDNVLSLDKDSKKENNQNA